ncbi:hypothetical protein J3A83DRAFT_4084490 [Scleroderma citrinum]
MSNERQYVDLLFRASKKFASWDPEKPVEVGDWGKITTGRPCWAFWRSKRSVFVKKGNIYKDNMVEKYGIPQPTVLGEEEPYGLTWTTSLNARDMDASTSMENHTPDLAESSVKAGFQFSPGGGAVLLMVNDSVTMINPAGSLRRLLEVKALRDHVIVSEVHRCSSYARYLASPHTKDIVIGLNTSNTGSTSAQIAPKWVRSNQTGNFKAKADGSGQRRYYPLYKLVSVREASENAGHRRSLDGVEGEALPLPDALPPWITHI